MSEPFTCTSMLRPRMDMTDDEFDQLIVQDLDQAFEMHIQHLESIIAGCDTFLSDMSLRNAEEISDPITCTGMFEAMFEPIT